MGLLPESQFHVFSFIPLPEHSPWARPERRAPRQHFCLPEVTRLLWEHRVQAETLAPDPRNPRKLEKLGSDPSSHFPLTENSGQGTRPLDALFLKSYDVGIVSLY